MAWVPNPGAQPPGGAGPPRRWMLPEDYQVIEGQVRGNLMPELHAYVDDRVATVQTAIDTLPQPPAANDAMRADNPHFVNAVLAVVAAHMPAPAHPPVPPAPDANDPAFQQAASAAVLQLLDQPWDLLPRSIRRRVTELAGEAIDKVKEKRGDEIIERILLEVTDRLFVDLEGVGSEGPRAAKLQEAMAEVQRRWGAMAGPAAIEKLEENERELQGKEEMVKDYSKQLEKLVEGRTLEGLNVEANKVLGLERKAESYLNSLAKLLPKDEMNNTATQLDKSLTAATDFLTRLQQIVPADVEGALKPIKESLGDAKLKVDQYISRFTKLCTGYTAARQAVLLAERSVQSYCREVISTVGKAPEATICQLHVGWLAAVRYTEAYIGMAERVVGSAPEKELETLKQGFTAAKEAVEQHRVAILATRGDDTAKELEEQGRLVEEAKGVVEAFCSTVKGLAGTGEEQADQVRELKEAIKTSKATVDRHCEDLRATSSSLTIAQATTLMSDAETEITQHVKALKKLTNAQAERRLHAYTLKVRAEFASLDAYIARIKAAKGLRPGAALASAYAMVNQQTVAHIEHVVQLRNLLGQDPDATVAVFEQEIDASKSLVREHTEKYGALIDERDVKKLEAEVKEIKQQVVGMWNQLRRILQDGDNTITASRWNFVRLAFSSTNATRQLKGLSKQAASLVEEQKQGDRAMEVAKSKRFALQAGNRLLAAERAEVHLVTNDALKLRTEATRAFAVSNYAIQKLNKQAAASAQNPATFEDEAPPDALLSDGSPPPSGGAQDPQPPSASSSTLGQPPPGASDIVQPVSATQAGGEDQQLQPPPTPQPEPGNATGNFEIPDWPGAATIMAPDSETAGGNFDRLFTSIMGLVHAPVEQIVAVVQAKDAWALEAGEVVSATVPTHQFLVRMAEEGSRERLLALGLVYLGLRAGNAKEGGWKMGIMRQMKNRVRKSIRGGRTSQVTGADVDAELGDYFDAQGSDRPPTVGKASQNN